METQRQRQIHRKEKLMLQNKVSELTAACSHLDELKSKSEDSSKETQALIDQKSQELSELQRQLVGLNQKVTHLESINENITSQMENLEQSNREQESRETELIRENKCLKLQVEEIASELSSNKATFKAKLSEIEEQLAESEEKVKLESCEKSQLSTQYQIEMENVKQTLTEVKREHLSIVENLEFRLNELQTLLDARTEKYNMDTEKMDAKMLRSQEHEKIIREAKMQLEKNLNEAQDCLESAVKEKRQQERAKEVLNELMNKLKLEKENLEKQNKLDKNLFEEQFTTLQDEMREKLDQTNTNHNSLLQDVRSEYENQILILHSQIQSLEQEKRSTETEATAKIASLETKLSQHIQEIERLENLSKESETEMKNVVESMKQDLKSASYELDSVKNELHVTSEAYLDQIHHLTLKISSAEEKYAELTHYSGLERTELEETIRIYGEQEKLLVDEYEAKLFEIGAKFDQERKSVQSTVDEYTEECEYLRLQLNETKNTLDSTREQHQFAIRQLKNEILSLKQALNDVQREKEIEITQLRNELMKLERNISTLQTTNQESLVLVTRKGEQIETLSGQLSQATMKINDLQKELSGYCNELKSEIHKHKLLEDKFSHQLQQLNREKKVLEDAKELQKTEFNLRYESLLKKHQTNLDDKQRVINQLEEKIIDLKSFIVGENLQEEWKKYMERQHTTIQDLDRQIRGKDSINQQMVKDMENRETIKNKLNQLEEEKLILLNLVEELSYLIDSENII